jgi:hypothetical protein
MKKFVFLFLLLAVCAYGQTISPPANATVFNNLDDKPSDDNPNGWGSCTSCAGGATNADVYYQQPYTTPSHDGLSAQFYMSGPAWSDVLFWNKVGPQDSFTHFQFNFWMMFNTDAINNGQALEFDSFQFAKGREYMFGTQCNLASGAWQVWNPKGGKWVTTSIACAKFTPNVWYHFVWTFHRSGKGNSQNVNYDQLTVVRYQSDGTTVAASNTYNPGLAYPSSAMPSGWSDDLGVQFQMDLAGSAGTMSEWADQVSLTVW